MSTSRIEYEMTKNLEGCFAKTCLKSSRGILAACRCVVIGGVLLLSSCTLVDKLVLYQAAPVVAGEPAMGPPSPPEKKEDPKKDYTYENVAIGGGAVALAWGLWRKFGK